MHWPKNLSCHCFSLIEMGRKALYFDLTSSSPNAIAKCPNYLIDDFLTLEQVKNHDFDWTIQIDLFRYILLNYRELLDEADIIELMASIANGWIIEDRTHNSTILIQSSYIEKHTVVGQKSTSPSKGKSIGTCELDCTTKKDVDFILADSVNTAVESYLGKHHAN